MNIQQFRVQYPQYGGFSDQELADRLYAKYYPTADRDEFMLRFLGRPVDLPPVPEGVPKPVTSTDGLEQFAPPARSAWELLDQELPEPVRPQTPEALEALSRFNYRNDNGNRGMGPYRDWVAGLGYNTMGRAAAQGAGIYGGIADAFRGAQGLMDDDSMVGDAFGAIADQADEWASQGAVLARYNELVANESTPENVALKVLSDGVRAVPDMALVIATTAATRNPNLGYAMMGAQVASETYGRSRYLEGKGVATALNDAFYATAAEIGTEKAFKVLEPIADAAMPALKTIWKTGLAETGAEGATAFLNILDEDFRQGMPSQDTKTNLTRIGQEGLTGGVAGMLMGGGGAAITGTQNLLDQRALTKRLTDQLGDLAMGRATDALDPEAFQSYQLRQGSPSGGAVPDFDAGFDAAGRDISPGTNIEWTGPVIDQRAQNIQWGPEDMGFAPQGTRAADDSDDETLFPELANDEEFGALIDRIHGSNQPGGLMGDPADQGPMRMAQDADGSFLEAGIDPMTIQTDPVAFQYKSEDIDAQGANKTLAGVKQWNPAAAGTIMVWERKDGQRFVVDGHQRLSLAKRLIDQNPKLTARVYREVDGFSQPEMRFNAALVNIAQNTGSVLDAAKVVREVRRAGQIGGLTPETVERVLPKSGAINKHIGGLVNLDDTAFQAVVNGVLKPEFAAIVGERYSDPGQQLAAIDALAKAEPETLFQARDILEQMDEAGFQPGQADIFGNTMANSYFKERAKIVEAVARRAKNKKALYGGLIRHEGQITGVGKNLVDVETNQRIVDEQNSLLAQIGVLARSNPEISHVLNIQAEQLGTGKGSLRASADAVERAFADFVERGGAASLGKQPTGPGIDADGSSQGQGRSLDRGAGGPLDQGAQPQEVDPNARPLFNRGLFPDATPQEQAEAAKAAVERRLSGQDRPLVEADEGAGGLFSQDPTIAGQQELKFKRGDRQTPPPDRSAVGMSAKTSESVFVSQEHLKSDQTTGSEFGDIELVKGVRRAARMKPLFDALVARAAAEIGGRPMFAGIKTHARAAEKIRFEYGGDVSRIKDLLRATIIVSNPNDVQRAIDAVVQSVADRAVPGKTMHRNGWADLNTDPSMGSEYRDGKVTFVLKNRHGEVTVEVQINVPEMVAAKDVAHRLYVEQSSLQRRGSVNDTPHAEALMAKQREIFRAVVDQYRNQAAGLRQESRSTAHSSGVTRLELSERAEARGNERGSGSNAVATPSDRESRKGVSSSNAPYSTSSGNESREMSGLSTTESIAQTLKLKRTERQGAGKGVSGVTHASRRLSQVIGRSMGVEVADDAYLQVKAPEAMKEVADAIKRVFGRDVVFVRKNNDQVPGFEGVVFDGKTIYINESLENPFPATAFHELLHTLRINRPDLYRMVGKAVLRATSVERFGAFRDAFNKLTEERGEGRLANEEVFEELVADTVADAFLDPAFLQSLAQENPSKFRELMDAIIKYLDNLMADLRGKDMGTSKYYRDIKDMRAEMAKALNEYAGVDAAVTESGGVYSSDNERATPSVQSRQRAARQSAPQLALDLPPAPELPEQRAQLEANFNTFYRHVPTGQKVHVGIDRVTNIEQAAHVFASVRKNAQENLMVLVLDKDGRILDLQRHGLGTRSSAYADPSIIVPSVVAIPGSARMYVSHNHPSGSAFPSDADRFITNRIHKAMDGSGVTLDGHVVWGRGTDVQGLTIDPKYGTSEMNKINILPRPRSKMTVPITERQVRRTPTRRTPITSQIEAINAARMIDSPHALMLVDFQHSLVGHLALTQQEMNKLRDGVMVRRIMRAIDTTNASGAIIKTEKRQDARNLERFFAASEMVRVVDVVFTDQDGQTRSALASDTPFADAGIEKDSRKPWYKRSQQTKTPEFKKWFGDSKVVDSEGAPLVVYHGTKRDFTEFKSKFDDGLLFFTTNPEFAGKWPVGSDKKGGLRAGPEGTDEEIERIRATEKRLWSEHMEDWENYDFDTPEGKAKYDADRAVYDEALRKEVGFRGWVEAEQKIGIQVMPVYLSIQNPFDPEVDYKKIEPVLAEMPRMEGIVESGLHKRGNWVVYEEKQVIEALKRMGYDGIWLAENTNGPHETIAAFSPTQVKSATGNRGTFDEKNPDIRFQRTWHGSSHKWDKPDLKKVGSGEGVQSYGWGFYTAQNRGVAKSYRKAGGDDIELLIGGERFRFHERPQNPREKAGNFLISAANAPGPNVTTSEALDRAIKNVEFGEFVSDHDTAAILPILKRWKKDGAVRVVYPRGNLYELDISDEAIEKMLDWDAPLSKQPEATKKAFNAELEGVFSVVDADRTTRIHRLPEDYGGISGAGAYDALSRKMGSQKAASEYLLSQGIPGIKYLDGGSRNISITDQKIEHFIDQHGGSIEAGVDEFMKSVHNTASMKKKLREDLIKRFSERTRNFVLFDVSLVNSVKRNNELVYQRQAQEFNQGMPDGSLFHAPEKIEKPKFSFGGEKANTANRAKLKKARDKADVAAAKNGGVFDIMGQEAREIWRTTGWFMMPDNQWRFEIGDEKARLTAGDLRRTELGGSWEKQNDFADLGALYDAYPALRNIVISVQPSAFMPDADGRFIKAGNYDETPRPEIDISNRVTQTRRLGSGRPEIDPKALSVLLHENTHAIQELHEGFAHGGSPKQFSGKPREFSPETWDYINFLLKDHRHLVPEELSYGDIEGPEWINKLLNKERWEKLPEGVRERLVAIRKEHQSQDPYTAHRSYMRLHGEAEARLVQKRLQRTDEENKKIYPLDDLDVPVNELIVRYQRSVAPADKMIVQHNISAEKLRWADKMGGLPMPSIGISKASQPLEGYGDITLLARPEMAAPSRGNPVYSADAYTASYPSITYTLSEADRDKFLKFISEPFGVTRPWKAPTAPTGSYRSGYIGDPLDNGQFERYGIDGLDYQTEIMARYLWEKGKMPSIENLPDPNKWERDVRDLVSDDDEYKAWAASLGKRLGVRQEEKIFSHWTNAGRKRFLPNTLENVVKMMKRDMRDQVGMFGAGALRAKVAPRFRSMGGLKKARDRLVSDKSMEQTKEEMNDRLIDISSRIGEYAKYGDENPFIKGDRVRDQLVEISTGLSRWDEYFDGVPQELKDEWNEYLNDLVNAPTAYFEAKPQRVVKLNEFTKALVPQKAPADVVEILERNGIVVERYTDAEDKARRMMADERVLFSRSRNPQTETREFKEWFAGSKVVDANGDPLKVYHGTRPGVDITEFKAPSSHDGIYFTPDPAYANGYTIDLFGRNDNAFGAVYPVYLSIQNPFVVETEYDSDEWIQVIDRGLDRADLEEQGYDGVILKDTSADGEIDQIIAFRPDQIKSATANTGAFSRESNDIRFQRSTPEFKKWFGDSKVVDDGGEPMVVYHGTNKDFTAFDTMDFGSWFAEDPRTANEYTEKDADGSPQVLPVYLSIKKPLVIPERFDMSEDVKIGTLLKAINKANGTKITPKSVGFDSDYEAVGAFELVAHSDEFIAAVKAAGFDGIRAKQDGAWSWLAFEPGQIKSATGNRGTFDSNNPDIRYRRSAPVNFANWTLPSMTLKQALHDQSLTTLEKMNEGTRAARMEVRQKLQDRMIPLRAAIDAIRAGGKAVTDFQDAYNRESLMYGRVGDRFEQIERRILEPMLRLAANNGISNAQLGEYLYALHAPSRNARIRTRSAYVKDAQGNLVPEQDAGSGMTDAEAAQIRRRVESGAKASVYRRLVGYVRQLTQETRNNYEKYQLVLPEVLDSWKTPEEFNETYVPLKGWEDSPENEKFGGVGRGFDIRGQEIQRALGRKTPPSDILSNVLADLKSSLIRGEKNAVGRGLYDLVKNNPNPDLWEHGTLKTHKVYDEKTGVVVERIDLGELQNADEVFMLKVNGEAKWVRLKDPRLQRAMKNLGGEPLDIFTRQLAKLNRWLSVANTMYNPEFVVSNFVRDLQTAAIKLTSDDMHTIRNRAVNPKAIKKSIGAMFRDLRGKNRNAEYDRYAREFKEDGAHTDYFRQLSIEDYSRHLNSMLNLYGNGAWGKARRGGRAVKDWIEDMNGAVENGVRLSVYIELRKSGVSRQQAATAAKNLTVNFNRKGEFGPKINAAYLFANAGMQGLTLAGATLKSKTGRKVWAALAVGGAIQALWNGLAGGEDDDGEPFINKVSDWERERNWLFMIPPEWEDDVDNIRDVHKVMENGKDTGGRYVKFPMPWVYNIPVVMGDAFVNTTMFGEKPGKAAVRTLLAINNAVNPVGDNSLVATLLPTILDIPLEVWQNTNYFGGPVYPERMPGDVSPDSSLSFRGTGKGWKEAAEFLNKLGGGDEWRSSKLTDVHPETLRHWFNQLTGGAGAFVNRVTENVGAALYGADIPGISGDAPLKPEQTIFLRKVYGRVWEGVDSQRYYDHREDLMQLLDEYEDRKESAKEGPDSAAIYRQFMRDNRDALGSGTYQKTRNVCQYSGGGMVAAMKTTDCRLEALRGKRKVLQNSEQTKRTKDRINALEQEIRKEQIEFNTKWNKLYLKEDE